MLATSLTAAVLGVEAHLVRVEADTASGFPKFTMLGLPDSSIKESEGRIRAALRNCGYEFKWDRRITVSMAPASLRKMGSSYDLATAVGLLAADGAVEAGPPVRRPARRRAGARRRPAPGHRRPAHDADGPAQRAARGDRARGERRRGRDRRGHRRPSRRRRCRRRWRWRARPRGRRRRERRPAGSREAALPDMADVRGQVVARRALEIAAAGGHNLIFSRTARIRKDDARPAPARHPAAADPRGGGRDDGDPLGLGRPAGGTPGRAARSAARITRPATRRSSAAAPSRAPAR